MKKNPGKIGILSYEYICHSILILVADIFGIAISFLFALWVRYDFFMATVPKEYLARMPLFLSITCLTMITVYSCFHLYRSIWSYASITEACHIAYSYIIIAVLLIIEQKCMDIKIPRSVLVTGYLMSGVSCVVVRFGYRLMRYILRNELHECHYRTMIIGAGQSGREIIKDIQFGRHTEYEIKVLVDDSRYKQGRYLEGIKIAGNRYDIHELVKQYRINTIIYAISEATPKDRAEILNICKETGCKIQVIPSLFRFVSGQAVVSKLRQVNVEDLLGRDEIKVNLNEILSEFTGKTVLVTGGGGSIGSELCRQLAKTDLKQLIIFDIYENSVYEIQNELKKAYPNLNLKVIIGSVRDEKRIQKLFEEYRPQIVVHAAAHKHVPLMEDSPNEAIKNNTIGTYKVAKAAVAYGVEDFLLISTDKAVNPTNIMGASKRLCEMIIQTFAKKQSKTKFYAVRFGNVLGSNGSVIPLFKRQIAEGGPVTVTDKNVVRYFMTIPEAVSLILQAGYYAKGGEIFVLDMGKPIRIDDMARDLIKLSGYKPDEEIKIVYTGLRPGEKLYEELLMNEEGLKKTPNKLIYIGHSIEFNEEEFEAKLTELEKMAEENNLEIKKLVAEIVPTYKPKENE